MVNILPNNGDLAREADKLFRDGLDTLEISKRMTEKYQWRCTEAAASRYVTQGRAERLGIGMVMEVGNHGKF
jgi:hypothetical protein